MRPGTHTENSVARPSQVSCIGGGPECECTGGFGNIDKRRALSCSVYSSMLARSALVSGVIQPVNRRGFLMIWLTSAILWGRDRRHHFRFVHPSARWFASVVMNAARCKIRSNVVSCDIAGIVHDQSTVLSWHFAEYSLRNLLLNTHQASISSTITSMRKAPRSKSWMSVGTHPNECFLLVCSLSANNCPTKYGMHRPEMIRNSEKAVAMCVRACVLVRCVFETKTHVSKVVSKTSFLCISDGYFFSLAFRTFL